MFGRALFGLALLGPPLVGVIAPAVSILRLRKRAPRTPSPYVVTGVLLAWLVLSVGVALLVQYLAFNYAWMWAHAKRPPAIGEEMTLLVLITSAMLIQAGCGAALHRLVRATGP